LTFLFIGRFGEAQGVIDSDYATSMVEILKDNARPEAGEVYGAMDMAWAKLVRYTGLISVRFSRNSLRRLRLRPTR
jgi:hypothetical protein